MNNYPTCPTCGSDDVTDGGRSPMYGVVLECCDCGATFDDPAAIDGPTDDDWIAAAYERPLHSPLAF